ncbi:ketosamine-3-kinase-like [Rhinophrynus dorsalis]
MFLLSPEAVDPEELHDQLKTVLKTPVLRPFSRSQGGCISQGLSFETDQGRVFVKIHSGAQAKTMFNGEVASLEAIGKTGAVRVPEPIAVTELPTGGAMLIMKHIEMRKIDRFAERLGMQIADLHLHNWTMKRKQQKLERTIGKCPTDFPVVDKFGFHAVTCCGYIPQVNEWQDDWVTFFTSQRLKPQLDLIEKDYGDRTVQSLWSELQIKVHNAFKDAVIFPSLLHGDLWEANVAEDETGPILFDPGSFYGHSEYELSIGEMFGVRCQDFYSAYHRKIPKSPGFEKRLQLYQLFHSLNNWNHFGLAFREGSLNLMRNLLEIL